MKCPSAAAESTDEVIQTCRDNKHRTHTQTNTEEEEEEENNNNQ